ncbi:MAG: DUF1150 family protein [Geminicoccaceae bacterium]
MQADVTSEPKSNALISVVPADAFVKPVIHENKRLYAIHAGDGRPLAMAPSRDLAFAFLRQNEMSGTDAH